jgi:hypothetical protein
MQVQIASENDKDKWNQFVDEECGSFFQYYDWKYFYEFNNWNRYIPLLIRDNTDSIRGIFPIVEQYGPIYPSLYSLPKGASDGFLLESDLNAHEQNLVVQSFLDYINNNYSQNHEYCFLRHQLPHNPESIQPSQLLIENGFTWLNNDVTKLPCTHILSLEKPFEEKIWSELWSKKLRKRIRHTRKSNVRMIIDDNLIYKDDFISMQIRTAKKYGSEVKKELLEQIFNIFSEKSKLFILLCDSKPIAGALCYYTPGMAYLAMAPYQPIAENYLTNTLPICASVRYACDTGYRNYEMGVTSTDSLAYHKEKFCARRIPLMMYYKQFSHFKMSANKFARSIIRGREKMTEFFGDK